MRPLRLEMHAFGPYAGRQVLDFAALKERRFFLIHGPTGSGKTTVLDAMAFALYGHTSGAERDAADMRSDQAAADVLTEVTFDFALGTERYRAWRRPAQERPKLRGEGVTTETQDATLWRLKTGNGGESGSRGGSAEGAPAGATASAGLVPDGKPLATGWTKVTAKSVEILGFRADQFRQVVMLPQGRFQELLKADSAGRAEILATLFGTEYYARLERELKDAAAAARKALDHVVQEREFVLAATGVESEEGLTAAREQAHEALAQACEERARRDEARAAAEAAERAAAETAARLAAAEQAAATLTALVDRRPEIDLLRQEEERARAAAAAAPAQRAAEERQKERADAERALTDALSAREQAEESRRQAGDALAAETAREAERAAAERRCGELEALRGRIGPLAAAQSDLASAEVAATEANGKLAEAREVRAQAEEALGEADAIVQATRAAAAEAGARDAHAKAAHGTVTDRQKLDELLTQQSASERAATSAEDACAKAYARWEEACARLAELEQRWTESQVVLLATQLEPGEPCPVCGSTEHPAPARATVVTLGPEELAEAREAVSRALAERTAAVAMQHTTAAERAALLRSIDDLRARLGDDAARCVEECLADAETARDAATASLEAAERLPQAEEALRDAKDAVRAAREEVTAAEAAATQTAGRLAAARATLDERASGLPDDLRDAEALELAIVAANKASAALKAAYEGAAARDRESALALGRAEAVHAAAEKALSTAQERETAAVAAFHKALVAHGFVDDDGLPSETAWLAATRSDEYVARLAAAIKAYDEELTAARARAAAATEAAAGLEPPDLDDLRSKAAAARHDARATQLQLHIESLDETAQKLAELRAKNEELDAHYTVIGHIARLASGDNRSGLTLQRFVLGALLDTVLIAATVRLRSMSKGRYHLLRTDERRGGRRAAGLDMDVYDTWTGKSRPVSTLSGGESFLAALALALGLAETVQARTGGVFLDTVFVDEGFGTLDDEALDLAIATLMQLQEGDRLVGIISHVAELKERIDARLEVTSERGTSTALFVVP